MLMMPRTGRISPSRDSSPTNRRFSRSAGRTCWARERIATAMGRSRWEPFLANSAGARLIVTFLVGKMRPELAIADRTRSRASETVLLAIPTILKAGRPLLALPSTSIIWPS